MYPMSKTEKFLIASVISISVRIAAGVILELGITAKDDVIGMSIILVVFFATLLVLQRKPKTK